MQQTCNEVQRCKSHKIRAQDTKEEEDVKDSRTWQHCAAGQSALVQTKIAKPKRFRQAMLVLAKRVGYNSNKPRYE